MEYLETSAAEEVNIDNAFRKMAKMILEKKSRPVKDGTISTAASLTHSSRKVNTGKNCCGN
jgi:hypothetical protein